MCNSPVVVQFGPQFFLIAVYFNSFCVKVNSIDEISFLEGLITLIPINISCGCKEKIKNNFCQSLWWYLISVKAELPRSGDLKSAVFFFLCQLPLLHLPDFTHPLKSLDDVCSPPSPLTGQTPVIKFMRDIFWLKAQPIRLSCCCSYCFKESVIPAAL